MKNVKYYAIGILLSFLMILSACAGESSERKSTMKEAEESPVYIIRENDVASIDDVTDILTYSDLVIEGTISEIGETVYIPFVDEKLEEKFIGEGEEPVYYSDIWTYYTIKVDEILYGECDDEIAYRCLGGTIDNVVLEQEIGLEKGEKYIFYLNKKDGIYVNSLNDNAITKIQGDKIIENNIDGKFADKYYNLSEYEVQFKRAE